MDLKARYLSALPLDSFSFVTPYMHAPNVLPSSLKLQLYVFQMFIPALRQHESLLPNTGLEGERQRVLFFCLKSICNVELGTARAGQPGQQDCLVPADTQLTKSILWRATEASAGSCSSPKLFFSGNLWFSAESLFRSEQSREKRVGVENEQINGLRFVQPVHRFIFSSYI